MLLVVSEEDAAMNRKDERIGAGDIEGIYLSELSAGDVLVIQTQNNTYSLVYLGAAAALLAKHSPRFAEPVSVNVLGSTWGGSALMMGFLGVGMCMEVQQLEEDRVLVTSPIQSLQRSPAKNSSQRLHRDSHGSA
jgi:hypothetical protein